MAGEWEITRHTENDYVAIFLSSAVCVRILSLFIAGHSLTRMMVLCSSRKTTTTMKIALRRRQAFFLPIHCWSICATWCFINYVTKEKKNETQYFEFDKFWTRSKSTLRSGQTKICAINSSQNSKCTFLLRWLQDSKDAESSGKEPLNQPLKLQFLYIQVRFPMSAGVLPIDI